MRPRPARKVLRLSALRTALLGAAVLAAVAVLSPAQGPREAGGVLPVKSESAAAVEKKGEAPGKRDEMIGTTDAFRIMQEGGILMYPIAFCSLVMVAFVFERMVSLRRGRVIPKPFVTRILQQIGEGQLDREQALALCEENGSPMAQVFEGAIRKWGRPAVEVEQAILDAGERATHGLRSHLRVFSAASTIAPLLGLLGTVFGMIQAFNSVAASNALGRPELLAHGVAQALLTTAFGLAVAIPALLFYYMFVGRVDRLVTDIDALGEELVHLISAEDIEHREESRAKPRRKARAETASEPAEEGSGAAETRQPAGNGQPAAARPQPNGGRPAPTGGKQLAGGRERR